MSRRRILIVDDEPDFTTVVKLNLEATTHYEVREVNDSSRTLAAARAFQPDLIFLDLVMPGTDGQQVVASLEADPLLKGVPIVFLTAVVTREETAEHGGVIGGRAFLAKPVSSAEIIACIERRLQGSAAPEGA